MSWFNYAGFIIVIVMMLPNIAYAAKGNGSFDNAYKNKTAEIFEQTGRYGCMAFMVFNIPQTYFGFWFCGAFIVYVVVNAVLCVAYIVGWAVFWAKSNKAKALTLSILPSCVFLFSGVMIASVPLLLSAVVFAVCHILISCKNAK